jgi:hypothetical protein
MGQVASINGTTMIVQGQGQQSTVFTVTLTDNTRITKQTTVDIASAPVGESISAVGTLDGDVFTATQVRIGATTAAGGPGAGLQGQGGNGRQPQPNGTAQPGGNRGQRLVGAIEQVSGSTLTVKTAEGTIVQVHLADNGQATQQVAGTQADITVGAQVMVIGAQKDSVVTATQVNVTPAAAKQQ